MEVTESRFEVFTWFKAGNQWVADCRNSNTDPRKRFTTSVSHNLDPNANLPISIGTICNTNKQVCIGPPIVNSVSIQRMSNQIFLIKSLCV